MKEQAAAMAREIAAPEDAQGAAARAAAQVPTFENYRLADTLYTQLQDAIMLEAEAVSEMEGFQLGVYFDTARGERIVVDYLGYHNPNLMVIYGSDANGAECQILAHVETVQLILKRENAAGPEKRKPIGFLGEISAKE